MIVEVGDKELLNEAVDEHLMLFEDSAQRVQLLIAAERFDEAKEALDAEGTAESLAPETKKMALLLAIRNEEWDQAEVLLKPLLQTMPRDLELFEMVTRVYKVKEDSERLAIAEENVKQLRELEDGIQAGLKEVGGNMDDAEGRIEIARMYLKLADYGNSNRWHALAARLDEQYNTEASDAVAGKGYPREPLVPFPADEEPDDDAADTKAVKPPAEDSASEKPAAAAEEKSPSAKTDAKADKEESATEAPVEEKAAKEEAPEEESVEEKAQSKAEETAAE